MTEIKLHGIDFAKGKDYSISVGGRSTGRTHAMRQVTELIESGKIHLPKNNEKLLNELKRFIYD